MPRFRIQRLASCFTSSITGKAPVPVPMTSWRHLQGMASFGDIGVCPKASRNCFGWLLLALADLAAINYNVMLVRGPVDAD